MSVWFGLREVCDVRVWLAVNTGPELLEAWDDGPGDDHPVDLSVSRVVAEDHQVKL